MPAEEFDGNTIRKARNAAAKGQDGWWTDDAMTGLAIRIQKGTASWYYKTRTKKASIGPLAAFGADDLAKLRGVVAKAREMERLGQDPVPLFREMATSKDAVEVIQKAAVASGEAMIWEQLRDLFVSEVKREPDTVRGYKSALGLAGGVIAGDMEPLNGKPCAAITVDDIQQVIANILGRGRASGVKNANHDQARITLSAIRSCMRWALAERIPTGMKDNVALRAFLPDREGASAYDDVEDQEPEDPRVLTLDECRKVIAAAHAYGNIAVGRAVLLQLYAGQRRMTVVQCRRRLITEVGDGTICWRVGPDKADKYRIIPLRGHASAVVRACLAAGRATDRWLFPMFRPRRVGGRDDHHMSERLLSRFLETIRRPEGPLGTAPWAGTHSLRKAFVTHVGRHIKDRRLGASLDTEMITRGDEGRVGLDETTYDLDPLISEKIEMLQAWEDMLHPTEKS